MTSVIALLATALVQTLPFGMGSDDYNGGSTTIPAPGGLYDLPTGIPGNQKHACKCSETGCLHSRSVITNQRYWWVWDRDDFVFDRLDADDLFYFTSASDFGKAMGQPDSYSPGGSWYVHLKWLKAAVTEVETHECGKVLYEYWVRYNWETDVETVTVQTTTSSEAGGGVDYKEEEAANSTALKDGWKSGFSFRSSVTSSTTVGLKPAWVMQKCGPINPGASGSALFYKCACGKKKKTDLTTTTVDPKNIDKLVGHLDDFAVDQAAVPVLPNAATIVIKVKPSPGDDFAEAETSAVVIAKSSTERKLAEDAVKVESGDDGAKRWTLDLEKLKEVGATALLTSLTPKGDGKTAVPIQYVRLGGAAAVPASFDASKPGIALLQPVTGGGAPNFTAAGGRTGPMVAHGSFGDGALALANEENGKLVRIAKSDLRVVVTQFDPSGKKLLDTAPVTWSGDLAKVRPNTRIVVLDEKDQFVPDTAVKLSDVIPAGSTLASAGPLKSPVKIVPEILKVGDSYTVTTRPTESDFIAFAAAKRLDPKIAARHVEVKLFVDDELAKSGTVADGQLKYEGRATSEGTVRARTELAWVGAETLPKELEESGTNVLKTTAEALGRVPIKTANDLKRNAQARFFSTATSPDR